MRARTWIADSLRKSLPKTWRVIDTEMTLDRPSTYVVKVSNQRIKRAEVAAPGSYDYTLNVRLISPNEDAAKAEAGLEDALDLLFPALEEQFGWAWDEAEKVLDPDTNTLAWDVPIRVYVSDDSLTDKD